VVNSSPDCFVVEEESTGRDEEAWVFFRDLTFRTRPIREGIPVRINRIKRINRILKGEGVKRKGSSDWSTGCSCFGVVFPMVGSKHKG
jgi:hypothetical protein